MLRKRNRRSGLTLVELIVAFTLLLVLSTMALPMAKVKVRRDKERRLRDALYTMRKAIDRYKDAADAGLLGEIDPDNHGYPESLEILVEGVEVQSSGMGMQGMPGMQGMQGMPGMQGMGNQGGIGSRSQRGSSAFGGRGGSSFGSSRGGSSFGSGGGRNSGFGSSRNSGMGSNRGGIGDDEEGPKKVRFLRKIPTDPITGTADWGMRAVSDDPNSMSWSGRNVFDVYSMSMETALDGTRYSEW